MKKRTIALVLVLILSLSLVTSAAATTYAATFSPTLSFSGTTAYCTISVDPDNSDDDVSVTMKLWDGSTCIRTWIVSNKGFTAFSRSATVESGKYYTLSVDVTINDYTFQRRSVGATCP